MSTYINKNKILFCSISFKVNKRSNSSIRYVQPTSLFLLKATARKNVLIINSISNGTFLVYGTIQQIRKNEAQEFDEQLTSKLNCKMTEGKTNFINLNHVLKKGKASPLVNKIEKMH